VFVYLLVYVFITTEILRILENLEKTNHFVKDRELYLFLCDNIVHVFYCVLITPDWLMLDTSNLVK